MSKTNFGIWICNTVFFTVKSEAQSVKSQLGICKTAFSSCKKLEDDVAAIMFECKNPSSTTDSNPTLPPELSSLSNTELEQQKSNLLKSVSI